MFGKRFNHLYNLIKSSIKIASRGFHPRCFFYWKLILIDHLEDELDKDHCHTKYSYSGNTSFAPFCNLTLSLALVSALFPTPVSASVPALIPTPISTPAPTAVFSDELLK